jgi:hypothetical protein
VGRLRRVTIGVVALALWWLAGSGAAWAQLQGHISTAKSIYLAGEPIYVHFEVTNVGSDAVAYNAGDAYNQGCGEYTIEVTSVPAVAPTSCERQIPIHCSSSEQMLAQGETQRQNILVNYFTHEVQKPGEYEIHAQRVLKYRLAEGRPDVPGEGTEFKLEGRVKIQVVAGNREGLERIYNVYVTNLGARDSEIQTEAERAIVSGAPPWLEDTIVGMLRKSTSREFALLGLKNLNTARSRDELAKIVESTSEFTDENERAVAYLAQMGDKKYYPLLQNLAQKQDANEAKEYVMAAAELGGDDALPYLQELLANKDPFARTNGLMGLEKTRCRAAVPLLIAALKDPKPDLEKLAAQGLETLTHRSAGESARGDAPKDQAKRWEKWWTAEGERAKLYGPGECGEIRELP